MIATSDGQGAKIICVIKTKTWQGKQSMCRIDGGITITPGHPIKFNQKWVYPRSISEPETIACPHFYNLIVDRVHIAQLNGIEVILLGHNYTHGILKHEYYGSQRVIEDLKKVKGFDDGMVELTQRQDGTIERANEKRQFKTPE